VVTETDYEPEVTKMVFINNRLQWTWKHLRM
jgi:hypothetical protein